MRSEKKWTVWIDPFDDVMIGSISDDIEPYIEEGRLFFDTYEEASRYGKIIESEYLPELKRYSVRKDKYLKRYENERQEILDEINRNTKRDIRRMKLKRINELCK